MLIKRLLLVTIMATVSMSCLAITPDQANDWAQRFGVQNGFATQDDFINFSHCARDEDGDFNSNPKKLLCSSVARAQGTLDGDTTLDGLGQSVAFRAAFPNRTDDIAAQYKIVYGANSTKSAIDAAVDDVHVILEEIKSPTSGGASAATGAGAGAGAGAGVASGPDLSELAPFMKHFEAIGITNPTDALAQISDPSTELFVMYNQEIKALFNTLLSPSSSVADKEEARKQLSILNNHWYNVAKDLKKQDRDGVRSDLLNSLDEGSIEYGRTFVGRDFNNFQSLFGL